MLSTFCFLHVLPLDIIKFYSRCPVLIAEILSFTLNSLILLQDVFYLTVGNQELNKTQTLTRATAANYRAPDVTPWMRPLGRTP